MDEALNRWELNRIIQTFLAGLHTQKRNIFIRRYYYADDISEIASRYGLTENHTCVVLCRVRKQLKKVLEEEGYGA